eukprot:11950385-Prorocentrum_lima.AAC.1
MADQGVSGHEAKVQLSAKMCQEVAIRIGMGFLWETIGANQGVKLCRGDAGICIYAEEAGTATQERSECRKEGLVFRSV